MVNESPRADPAELIALIAQALRMADALELGEVGISLDRALVTLTGHGVIPPGGEAEALDKQRRAEI